MLRSALILLLLAWSPVAANAEVPSPDIDHALPPVTVVLPSADAAEANSLARPLETESWTLADVEAVALEHNPTLAAALARMEAARGKRLQAGLFPNPVVGYHGVEMGLRGTSGQQGAFISQRFITAGKLNFDQAIVGRELREAHAVYHAQQQKVLSDVRVRFFDTLVAQRRVTLTEELAGIGRNLVAATEKLLAGRQGTENDLLQAEIKADESLILLDNARNQQLEAWRRLAAVIGKPALRMSPVTGDLDSDSPVLDWDQCHAMVLRISPELNAARARADRARLVIQRARIEPIPNVDLSVSHRHHNVTSENVTNVQVGIPIPIFDQNQGKIRSAKAELVVACRDIERIELDLQDRLAVAYRRYANARQQVDRYSTRMLPRAERSLALVTNGYEQGQIEYLLLLTAQQTYLRVNLSYLDSLRELRSAAAFIDGQLLGNSLSSPPGEIGRGLKPLPRR